MEKNEKDGIGAIASGICAFIFIILADVVGTFPFPEGTIPQQVIMGAFLAFAGVIFIIAGHYYFLRGVLAGKSWYGFVGLGVNIGAAIFLILLINGVL
jgi:hypothetical protein